MGRSLRPFGPAQGFYPWDSKPGHLLGAAAFGDLFRIGAILSKPNFVACLSAGDDGQAVDVA
jgi:hypothetical protein